MQTSVSFDFSGATVLVTGATHGIGACLARAYRDAGASVHITGRRAAISDYEGDFSGLHYHPLDVRDPAVIEHVATSLPALDILINNAGTSLPGGRSEYEPEVFDEALHINLGSVYRMSHACLPLLRNSTFPGGASVIGIASMSSYFGIEIVPGYGAAKTGLVGLTRTLAVAWAREGIRVNAVAAGLVRSNMTAAMLEIDDMTRPMVERTPLRRVGEPEDIAGPVLFLTSPAAAYITGQTLPVDGGYTVQG